MGGGCTMGSSWATMWRNLTLVTLPSVTAATHRPDTPYQLSGEHGMGNGIGSWGHTAQHRAAGSAVRAESEHRWGGAYRTGRSVQTPG